MGFGLWWRAWSSIRNLRIGIIAQFKKSLVVKMTTPRRYLSPKVVEEEFTCPVCLSIYDQPQRLNTCNHTWVLNKHVLHRSRQMLVKEVFIRIGFASCVSPSLNTRRVRFAERTSTRSMSSVIFSLRKQSPVSSSSAKNAMKLWVEWKRLIQEKQVIKKKLLCS